MGFLVFTDLDGTLLDHHDYSWVGARSALAEINRRRIPLIFTTSKTRAELQPLRNAFGNDWPFITENGGAVFFPLATWPCPVPGSIRQDEFQVLVIGRRYDAIRAVFEQLRADFPIRGFGDMSVPEIVMLTGLEQDEALLARQREFSEPFLLQRPDVLDALTGAAAGLGCSVAKGGRFYHLMDREQDKGSAVAAVIAQYKTHFGECTSLGLGDSANDLPMLDRVDIPVLIAKPDGSHEQYQADQLIRSSSPGSKGWGETVLKIISRVPAEL